MNLAEGVHPAELDNVHKNNIRFRAIGRIQELDESVRRTATTRCRYTKANTGMLLNVALNYSGRAELVDTFNRLAIQELRTERAQASHQRGGDFAASLYTSGIPDPDSSDSTSGEMRVSNFLLWQIAYSEIYVTPTYWPDFRRKHLFEAILDYQRRDRRYGGI